MGVVPACSEQKEKDNAETLSTRRGAEEERRGSPSDGLRAGPSMGLRTSPFGRLRAGPFGRLRVNRRGRRVGSRRFTIYDNTGIVPLSIVNYIV